MKTSSRIVYQLDVADVQNVAQQILERDLTTKEISRVEKAIGDHIHWFDAIELAINEQIKQEREQE